MRLKLLVVAISALLFSHVLFSMDYDPDFDLISEQAVRSYTMECAGCHGSNAAGRNGMAPNFSKEWFRLTKSDDELVGNLRAGFRTPGKFYNGGSCPPSALSSEELVDIFAVMRQFVGQ